MYCRASLYSKYSQQPPIVVVLCISCNLFFFFFASPFTQSLMAEVVQNSNVIQVTNEHGFQENLEALQQRLSVCEKALAEYLETKRLTFPRFYFVSASDLLEIVSKGTQPKQVNKQAFYTWEHKKRDTACYCCRLLYVVLQTLSCVFQVTRHLLKLFDNIADLRFKESDRLEGDEEDGAAVAIGMYSREREYVPFSEPCVCEGQVLRNYIFFLCVQIQVKL